MGDGPAVLRAFVALELDDGSVRRLERIAAALRAGEGAPKATWTRPEKWHLTLRFMGALPASSVQALASGLAARVVARPPPAIGPLRLGAFPSPARAEIVIAHVADPAGDLARLARDADAAADEVGLEREARAFRPHITLARTRRKVDARRWLAGVSVDGEAIGPTHVTLFRSDIEPTGSVYVAVARFPFRPAGATID